MGLLETLLAAYPQDQIAIAECDQSVGPKAASALALIFHETATNAVKYGALSTPNGRVEITCQRAEDATSICWEESGGPIVEREPERRGFGSFLAERIARAQLDADFQRFWQPGGLKLILRVSSNHILT